MMKTRKDTPFLTPTYQSIFQWDLAKVNECYLYGEYVASFEALRMLYADLLKKPRAMMKKHWEQFLQKKGKIRVPAHSFARNLIRMDIALNDFLYREIPKIKAKFVVVLEECNLLNLDMTVKARYEHKGKLAEL